MNSEGCNGPPSAASCLIAGVDDPGRVLADLADRDDAAILDRAVGAHRVVPEPVDYCCSADHEVMHRDFPCLSSMEDI